MRTGRSWTRRALEDAHAAAALSVSFGLEALRRVALVPGAIANDALDFINDWHDLLDRIEQAEMDAERFRDLH